MYILYLNIKDKDIRDVAFEVNDRLKTLILPADDKDETTDLEDKSAVPTPRTTPRTTPQSSPQIQRKDKMVQPTQAGGKQQQQQQQPSSTKTLAVKQATEQSSSPLPTYSATTDQTTSPKTGQGITESQGTSDSENTKSKLLVFKEIPKLRLLPVLGVLIDHMKFTHEETRMETLRWMMWLHQQLPKRVSWFTLGACGMT